MRIRSGRAPPSRPARAGAHPRRGEEIGVLGIFVLDRDLDVADRLAQLGRERGQDALDVLVEGQ
jgi:hypothetical protein